MPLRRTSSATRSLARLTVNRPWAIRICPLGWHLRINNLYLFSSYFSFFSCSPVMANSTHSATLVA